MGSLAADSSRPLIRSRCKSPTPSVRRKDRGAVFSQAGPVHAVRQSSIEIKVSSGTGAICGNAVKVSGVTSMVQLNISGNGRELNDSNYCFRLVAIYSSSFLRSE